MHLSGDLTRVIVLEASRDAGAYRDDPGSGLPGSTLYGLGDINAVAAKKTFGLVRPDYYPHDLFALWKIKR